MSTGVVQNGAMQSNVGGPRRDGGPSLQSGTMGETNFNLKDWQEVPANNYDDKLARGADSASMTSTQRNIPLSGMMSTGVADFFSPEIFQIVLHNPTTSHQLLQFSQSRFCGENMEFLEKVRIPASKLATLYPRS